MLVMSLRRIGKGWGKTIPQQWLERNSRDMAIIQQKKLTGSDTIAGKENAQYHSSGTNAMSQTRTAPTGDWRFPAGLPKGLCVTEDSGS